MQHSVFPLFSWFFFFLIVFSQFFLFNFLILKQKNILRCKALEGLWSDYINHVSIQLASWSMLENSSIVFQFLVRISKTEQTKIPVMCLKDTYVKPGSPCQQHLACHCFWIEEVINTENMHQLI